MKFKSQIIVSFIILNAAYMSLASGVSDGLGRTIGSLGGRATQANAAPTTDKASTDCTSVLEKGSSSSAEAGNFIIYQTELNGNYSVYHSSGQLIVRDISTRPLLVHGLLLIKKNEGEYFVFNQRGETLIANVSVQPTITRNLIKYLSRERHSSWSLEKGHSVFTYKSVVINHDGLVIYREQNNLHSDYIEISDTYAVVRMLDMSQLYSLYSYRSAEPLMTGLLQRPEISDNFALVTLNQAKESQENIYRIYCSEFNKTDSTAKFTVCAETSLSRPILGPNITTFQNQTSGYAAINRYGQDVMLFHTSAHHEFYVGDDYALITLERKVVRSEVEVRVFAKNTSQQVLLDQRMKRSDLVATKSFIRYMQPNPAYKGLNAPYILIGSKEFQKIATANSPDDIEAYDYFAAVKNNSLFKNLPFFKRNKKTLYGSRGQIVANNVGEYIVNGHVAAVQAKDGRFDLINSQGEVRLTGVQAKPRIKSGFMIYLSPSTGYYNVMDQSGKVIVNNAITEPELP